MAVRQDQETVIIQADGLTNTSSHVRQDAEVLLLMVPSSSGTTGEIVFIGT